jgi:CRISPR system Cascade subunit CasB
MNGKYALAEERYVESIIERIKTDTKMRACLSRADNPDTSYQSWEYLLRYGVDIDKETELLRYGIVSAAIARGKPEKNGNAGIGKALAMSYETHGESSEPAVAKLRRLLACDSVQEVCSVLSPLIRLIHSKSDNKVKLDYASLLADLKFFGNNNVNRIKAKWAKDFFRKDYKEE